MLRDRAILPARQGADRGAGSRGAGTIHAVADQCTASAPLWSAKPAGASYDGAPVVLGSFLYAGADDGRVHQLRASDGVANSWATIAAQGDAPSSDPIVVAESSLDHRLLAVSGQTVKKLCIPWPDTFGDQASLSRPVGAFIALLRAGAGSSEAGFGNPRMIRRPTRRA